MQIIKGEWDNINDYAYVRINPDTLHVMRIVHRNSGSRKPNIIRVRVIKLADGHYLACSCCLCVQIRIACVHVLKIMSVIIESCFS